MRLPGPIPEQRGPAVPVRPEGHGHRRVRTFSSGDPLVHVPRVPPGPPAELAGRRGRSASSTSPATTCPPASPEG
ncbi:MAG: hypothetical protein M0C28_40020 [Candidatus Moduliflexus flocculans]|nr:hypothetical protein [Candidatus Moduliflexus flocculans]